MGSSKIDIDMCNGPLFKKILIFSLPIMAVNFLQLLFNTIDMIVVGQFSGRDALAAVGATGYVINLIVNLFMGLSIGTSVVTARDHGAGDPEAVSRSVHTSITISVIAGILVMIIGIALTEPMLQLVATPQDIFAMSALYMKIYFVSVPGLMIFNFCAAILRSVGDSRHPMYFLIISGIIHVVLDLFFVLVLRMSVDGVAWATVISQYLSVLLVMFCLYRFIGPIRFIPGKLRVDLLKLKEILRIGLPAGIQSLLFSISHMLVQSAINSFGSVSVAANSAANNVEGYVFTAINAYYNAAITFTAQNMGAKKYERVDIIAKVCTVLIFVTWLIPCSLVMIFGSQLLGIFTTDTEVIELGMLRINITMAGYFACGAVTVYPGLIRGMGYSILPMLCTLVGACLMRIVWILTVFTWHPTMFMLLICFPITWFLAGLGHLVIFFYVRGQIRRRVAADA